MQAGTLPVAVEPDFERFIAGRRALLDARLTAVDAKAKDGLLPDVTLDEGRAEDRADRKIDAAGGRDAGRPALRDAAAHSHHRPAVRGGALDTGSPTASPIYAAAKRPPTCDPDGRPAGRRAQSRPDAHGRGLQHRQPRPARLGRRLAYPRRDLRPGAAAAWSTSSSARPWRQSSAMASPRHRTASSSGPPASAAMPAASMPITASDPESRSTRISPTATRRSTPS